MLKAIMVLVLLCSNSFIYASDDEELQNSIPFPRQSLSLKIKGGILSDDVVQNEIYSHAIKCMREEGVKQISAERMQSVYVSLKDLERRTFETELEAIHICRDQIDELVSQRYLAFLPRTHGRVFGR